MIAVKVKNLTKYFGDKKVLDNINFEVKKGEIFGILGHNGAGKSTTLRILAGIIKDYDGEVKIEGITGYLPEERGLYREERVIDILKFFAELANANEEILEYYIKKFGIEKYKKEKIKNLSKGNQQKVQFIITLLKDPDILILDEPFSGLDVSNIKLFKDIIMEFKEKNRAIILSTHILENIEKLCDRVLILKEGKVKFYGSLAEICRKVVYIEYIDNGQVKRLELNYDKALEFVKNNLDKIIKFEVRYSIEELMFN
ncbi:ABC transporter ATP-binding protein [Methanocaldococcus sp.]